MSQIGISPELKKKILNIEYACLTKGKDYLSKEEREILGSDSAKIKIYSLMSQKYLPFVFLNNVRGEFDGEFFEHLDELVNWFNSRSSTLSVVLIPSDKSVTFINELLTKGFVFSGYLCYWYKLLDGDSYSSFDNNNIIEVTEDLADIFAETVTKGFQVDPQDSLYNHLYNSFKFGYKFPFSNDFLYKNGSKFIGTGSIVFEEDFSFLGAGSVLPAYRGKHIQQELVNCRLDYAKSNGIRHAIVTTGLDTTSGRNMERLGFQLAFTGEFFSYSSNVIH